MNDELLLLEFNNSNAKNLGVVLPAKGTQKYETLKYYFENKGKIISKKEAEKVIFNRLNIQAKDLQDLRHLAKQDGFNILQGPNEYDGFKIKRGEYIFLGFDDVNEYWSHSRRKEEKDLDFENIKLKFNNCCATCGEKEGKNHRYTKDIVKLEKGHKDPRLSMSNDNIIPQCGYCNKRASDKFVFDEFGFIKYLTNEGLKSLPLQIKQEYFQILKEEFK